MLKLTMRWIVKCLLLSATVVAIVAAIVLAIGFFATGRLTLDAAFTTNYFVSFMALLLGFFSFFLQEHAADLPSSRFGRLASISTSLVAVPSTNMEEVKTPPQANPKGLRLNILQRARFLIIALGIFAITLSAQLLL